MQLISLIKIAQENGASDLHLEPGLPMALRVRGALRVAGEPMRGDALMEIAKELIGSEDWEQFLIRRSFDMSKTVAGARCRINILKTARGVGFAIRLLPSFETTLESLNLHPDFKKLVEHSHGLVLICGPTGSGKSSTLAALIQTINLSEARHIVTIESPIEFSFKPHHSFIRQREVGRDTPSFDQALIDSLREDPDVLMVGELREPETMRLTLSAAETGHLVLATVHSSTCAEAMQRIVGAFPAEIQNNVSAQLADCLIAVISQRLQYHSELGICIPECEVLMMTNAVKHFIRSRDFFKMQSSLETGAEFGMWTFERYRNWLSKRGGHFNTHLTEVSDESDEKSVEEVRLPAIPVAKPVSTEKVASKPSNSGRIEIEPTDDFGSILKK